jgi:hypothetical protein
MDCRRISSRPKPGRGAIGSQKYAPCERARLKPSCVNGLGEAKRFDSDCALRRERVDPDQPGFCEGCAANGFGERLAKTVTSSIFLARAVYIRPMSPVQI